MAILFEAVSPEALNELLVTHVTAAGIAARAGANSVNGELEVHGGTAIPYRGIDSADRKVCSYVARLGNVVVVTNSLVQFQHLADVQNHRRYRRSPTCRNTNSFVAVTSSVAARIGRCSSAMRRSAAGAGPDGASPTAGACAAWR